jgi:glycosyltransferase involved in cell wall biosynthesis
MNQPSAKNTLRIALMGTRGIPARYGGFETFAEQLSSRLVARGHEVIVYERCRFWDRWGSRPPVDGVERRSTPTIYHKYLETPLNALTSFIDVLFQRVDAILVCNAANSPCAPLLKIKGVPLLINVDGIERNRAKWNALGKAWYRLGEWCSVKLATRIVSDAEVIGEYYQETYGIESTVIPYGVHPVRRDPGETLKRYGLDSNKYLLYVSRLEPENNALGVIEAYNSLQTSMPLVIVGDAPYATEYKKKLRTVASDGVIFTGFQFGSAYQELQSNCFAYIQATEVGGTHPALIEAMSYRNCVIANGTPENLEVVGDGGLCFRKNDFRHLKELLQGIIDDPQQMESFAEKAYRRVMAEYSWDAVVSQYEQLFSDLTGKAVGVDQDSCVNQ